ncbi:Hsp20 family protein [Acuticoccus sp. I52.16.1]|uniref:Hsp20 family protein n=1 Tax=Acuticoccus sp. I52.16.1 TaxID=2928472 RepID=UPI001FD101A6|nr:Hsp20 family protein [Acuticoccus sp. I52.16.1]UOM36384.1 Hsp20 family protein [Acuticoccus sp. I52.16.1]
MTRMTPLSSPLLLGFEDIERVLDRVTKSGSDGYPPYNIERIKGPKGDLLRITLAVAGFSRDQLSVTVEDNQLVIRGSQSPEADRDRHFLHRGIAARQFQRAFVLAEGIEILSAALADGLLAIDLVRPEPARTVRTIEISASEQALEPRS